MSGAVRVSRPREEDYAFREILALEHDPSTMSPLSHIVRFFTSCVKVLVDTKPDQEYCEWSCLMGRR